MKLHSPIPPIAVWTRSPGVSAAIGPSAPASKMSPAFSGSPRSASVRASQAAALSGLERYLRDVLAAANHITQVADNNAGSLGGYMLSGELPPLLYEKPKRA